MSENDFFDSSSSKQQPGDAHPVEETREVPLAKAGEFDALITRAKGWKESDLRKYPTATLELIDALVNAAGRASMKGLGFDAWYESYDDVKEYDAGMRDAFEAGYASDQAAHAAELEQLAVDCRDSLLGALTGDSGEWEARADTDEVEKTIYNIVHHYMHELAAPAATQLRISEQDFYPLVDRLTKSIWEISDGTHPAKDTLRELIHSTLKNALRRTQ